MQRIRISQDICRIRGVLFAFVNVLRLCNVTLSNSASFLLGIRIVRRLSIDCLCDVNGFRRAIYRN